MLIKSLLTIFVGAMLPVGELRAVIPLGLILYKLNPLLVLVVGVSGNIIPIFVIYHLADVVIGWAARSKNWLAQMITKVISKTRLVLNHKHQHKGMVALLILAATPVPLLGGIWTATVAAYLLNIPLKKAWPYLVVGALLSGVIITVSVLGVVNLGRLMSLR